MLEISRNEAVVQPEIFPNPSDEKVAMALGVSGVRQTFLAGDGSDRSYYRVFVTHSKKTYVLMQLSFRDRDLLTNERGYDWVRVGQILAQFNIPRPNVIVSMPEDAALIIDDYGDIMLESVINDASAKNQLSEIERYFDQCFEMIKNMLQIPPQSQSVWCQRGFDQEKYAWELHFFYKKFFQQLLGISLDKDDLASFDWEVTELSKYLAQKSSFFVHRDFHSRNIMVKDKSIALIDFQDARLGSRYYDLVSLVGDNYLTIANETRSTLMARGLEEIEPATDWEELGAIFLQRQLKAIGSYAYLTVDKSRGNYLQYVNPAISMLLEYAFVQNNRWSFLSQELPRLIKQKWQARA